MKTDQDLLREFVKERSERAFSELTQRYAGLVYGAALRETRGDEAASKDLTQLVFIELARKAASLQGHPTLTGWLYTSVRFLAANIRRAEHRRIQREEKALTMNDAADHKHDPAWEELKPVLDDAMHDLTSEDRTAVLLRFFQGKSLREVGLALSLTENAARMRVDRALEKLAKLLGKRGVHSSGEALAKLLPAAVVFASPAFIAAVTSSALATTLLPGTTTFVGLTTMAKLKWIGLGTLAITMASVVTWQEHQRSSISQENATLRERLSESTKLSETNQELNRRLAESEARRQAELRELSQLRGTKPGSPQLITATGPDDAQNSTNAWRERFDAIYQLRNGEIIRRVGAPFIQERDQFYHQTYRGKGPPFDFPKSAPDYFVFRTDENGNRLENPNANYAGGKPTVDHVLRHVLGLGRDKYFGADELLELPVQGDWILRNGASMESTLVALQPILSEVTGKNIRFEKQKVEEDVIVVRGTFNPPKGAIDIFAENKNSAGGGSGNFDRFLDRLGDRLNIPFVNEAQTSNAASIEWKYYSDSRFDRRGSGVPLTVLENLSRQTGLQFEIQRRPTEVWMVKE